MNGMGATMCSRMSGVAGLMVLVNVPENAFLVRAYRLPVNSLSDAPYELVLFPRFQPNFPYGLVVDPDIDL